MERFSRLETRRWRILVKVTHPKRKSFLHAHCIGIVEDGVAEKPQITSRVCGSKVI